MNGHTHAHTHLLVRPSVKTLHYLLPTDTAMSTCHVQRTCTGQAGHHGNAAQSPVGEACKPAAGLVRMGTSVPAAAW